MATIAPTINDVSNDRTAYLFTWVLTAADDGAPIGPSFINHSDCCVQATGTFDGATVVFEGSNVGTTYGALFNVQGVAISVSAALAPKQVVEVPQFRRPRTSGGGGTTSITFTALVRRQQQARV